MLERKKKKNRIVLNQHFQILKSQSLVKLKNIKRGGGYYKLIRILNGIRQCCVCVHMSVCVCVQHVPMEAKGQPWLSFLRFRLLFLETGSLFGWSFLIWLGWVALGLQIYLFPLPQQWGCCAPPCPASLWGLRIELKFPFNDCKTRCF